MKTPSPLETIARAEDTNNLLEHIAWTDTILPAILKHRAAYEAQLVGAVLGQRPRLLDGQTLTPEQLAGRIDGITYTIKLLEQILRDGERALTQIQSTGYNPEVTFK